MPPQLTWKHRYELARADRCRCGAPIGALLIKQLLQRRCVAAGPAAQCDIGAGARVPLVAPLTWFEMTWFSWSHLWYLLLPCLHCTACCQLRRVMMRAVVRHTQCALCLDAMASIAINSWSAACCWHGAGRAAQHAADGAAAQGTGYPAVAQRGLLVQHCLQMRSCA